MRVYGQLIRAQLENLASDPTPAADGMAYFNTTSKTVRVHNGVGWEDVGTGGGGDGGINYVTRPDGEVDTTGWSLYADAAANPVDGTGGSATATFAKSSSNPLRGTNSFLFTQGTLGDGVAYTITPDRADILNGAVLTGSFEYEPTVTNLAEGDYRVWIYDVANSTLIQPAPYMIPSSVVGMAYKFQFEFQVPTNGTTFRVLIHQAVADPGNLKLDSIVVGPNPKQYGAMIGDWQSYTPTGNWNTNTTYAGKWRRVGDSIEVSATVTLTGAPNSASFSLNLPSGLAFDTGKMGTNKNIGAASLVDFGLMQYGPNDVFQNGASAVYIVLSDSASTYLRNQANVDEATPFTFGNTDYVSITFKAPVLGWSSSVQVSSDADTRVVDFYGTKGNQAVTADVTDLTFTSVKDTHGAWGGSSYTVKVPGDYVVSAGLTDSAANSYYFRVYVNGSLYQNNYLSGTIGGRMVPGSLTVVNVKAGDTISIRADATQTVGGYGQVAIHRIAGPSQIAASEKVYFSAYRSGSTQSVSSSSVTTVVFNGKESDSHGAFSTSTGKFTSPKSMELRLNATVQLDADTYPLGTQVQLQAYRTSPVLGNQLYVLKRLFTPNYTSSTPIVIDGSKRIKLLAGDTVEIRIFHDHAGSELVSFGADATYFDGEEAGN